MRSAITTTLLVIFTAASLCAHAQFSKDACTLITDVQINKIIGSNVKQAGPALMMGKRCLHKAADAKSEAVLEYFDWRNDKTAFEMVKTSYNENKNNISAGRKAVGVYTSMTDFPEGGQFAYVVTADGDATTNGNLVRLQFVIGTVVYTFDTKGIDKTRILPKVKEIYNTIMANAK